MTRKRSGSLELLGIGLVLMVVAGGVLWWHGLQARPAAATPPDYAGRTMGDIQRHAHRADPNARVILSAPLSDSQLEALVHNGKLTGRSYYAVIVKGDFDGRGLLPAAAPAERPVPASYILYVYDLTNDEVTLKEVSPTGLGLGPLLNDPSLPDAAAPQADPAFQSVPRGTGQP